jgi:hypothetical protein
VAASHGQQLSKGVLMSFRIFVRPSWALLAVATSVSGCMVDTDTTGAEELGEVAEGLTYQVGPGQAYASLQAVAASLKPGDVVHVAGDAVYSGGIRLTKSGTASSKIRIVGVRVNGKRPVLSGGINTIEFAANHLVFEGFDVTAGSSRCVYHHGHDITIRDSVIHDCPAHGILGADSGSGSLTLEHSEVYRSGSGDRLHQIYMATDETAYPGAVFRMQHCYVHDANGGNNVKSRAERNEIYYNWIEGAYYHELELIGPDGQTESLKREDSDVVGNVLYQGYTTRSHYPIRIGGDGTGQTFGRYRFVNNTIVLGNSSSAAAFRVFDGIESVEMHNNALFRLGGGPVTVLTDANARWKNGRQIAGSNNWLTSGSTAIPSTWTSTKQAASPGFTNVAGRDLTLSLGSPLRDAGSSTFAGPAGYAFPSPLAMPAYEPPRHLLAAAATRLVVGATDIGAFEHGGTGVVTPPASPVTLPSVADSFVRNGTYAATAYGSATVLDVKTDTTAGLSRDAYLRFDLGALPSVSNARLRVHAALSAADSVAATLYPVTGAWSESTLTWNTRPGYVTATPLGSVSATSGTAAWKELDITAHVKAELAAGRRVFAMALHATAPSVEKMVIASRESGSGPQLVVTP